MTEEERVRKINAIVWAILMPGLGFILYSIAANGGRKGSFVNLKAVLDEKGGIFLAMLPFVMLSIFSLYIGFRKVD